MARNTYKYHFKIGQSDQTRILMKYLAGNGLPGL